MSRPNLQRMFGALNIEHFDGEIPDLPVSWSRRLTTTSGICSYRRESRGRLTPSSIRLSEKLFASLDYDLGKITRTLLHEMTHAYLLHKYDERGHTARFQAKMTEVTGEVRNHRCHDYDTASVKRTLPKKVRAECQRCGHVYFKARMPKHAAYSTYTHRKCGGAIKFFDL